MAGRLAGWLARRRERRREAKAGWLFGITAGRERDGAGAEARGERADSNKSNKKKKGKGKEKKIEATVRSREDVMSGRCFIAC